MPITKKWSAFPSTTATTAGDSLVGLHSGVNERFLVSAAPSASAVALWDANSNISASNVLKGYATTETAAGTTVLTVASKYNQYFTGITTQTVTLPVAATLALGQSFYIVNNSTGVVTVQSSGANTIQAMDSGTALLVTCILTSGTTGASWSASVLFANTNVTGSGKMVLQSSPLLVTPNIGAATASSITFQGSTGILGNYANAVTFTPTFTFATPGDLSVSYSIQTGRSWQIGALFLISYTIRFTPTYTTASGQARFGGIAISGGSYNWVLGVSESSGITFAGTQLVATIPGNYIVVNYQGTGVASTALSTTNFVSGVQYTLIISGMYGT
jgi:hypothetical protein